MSLITFKLIAAFFIFIIATLAGLLPTLSHHHQHSRHISDAITNGIFLGAAIFHMLPDSQEGFLALGVTHYPYAILLSITGFILLQLIKYLTVYISKEVGNHTVNAFMILFAISFHSLVEGAALGINVVFTNAFVIFIAIIAHKSCDSFALAMTLKRYNLFEQYQVLVIILFALLTPIGIAIASTVMGVLTTRTGVIVEASLNALAAGTFIYIGAMDVLDQQFKTQSLKQRVIDFIALLVGMGIMGFIAIWV